MNARAGIAVVGVEKRLVLDTKEGTLLAQRGPPTPYVSHAVAEWNYRFCFMLGLKRKKNLV